MPFPLPSERPDAKPSLEPRSESCNQPEVTAEAGPDVAANVTPGAWAFEIRRGKRIRVVEGEGSNGANSPTEHAASLLAWLYQRKDFRRGWIAARDLERVFYPVFAARAGVVPFAWRTIARGVGRLTKTRRTTEQVVIDGRRRQVEVREYRVKLPRNS